MKASPVLVAALLCLAPLPAAAEDAPPAPPPEPAATPCKPPATFRKDTLALFYGGGHRF